MESAEPQARQPLATAGEVAAYLGLTEKTLANWRARRKGPKYKIVGRETRYAWPDVYEWYDSLPGSPASGGRPAA